MMIKWVLIGVFSFFVAVGAGLYFLKGAPKGDAAEVDWQLLNQMDYLSQKAPDALQKHHQQRVKIPGFMVPLEDNSRLVVEFLLVPNPQACIHVPPPPPNQMVYIKMKKGTPAAFGPIWVYGEFKIAQTRSKFGEASFEMDADFVEPYR